MTDPEQLNSSEVIHRLPGNPILSKDDVPYASKLVFNAGVTKFQGRYVMVFRNDTGQWGDPAIDQIHLGLAFSDDGINWKVEGKPFLDIRDDEIMYVYDARLTVIEEKCYICCALHTKHGMRGCIAVTDDFGSFDVLHMTVPDNRNLVLFPNDLPHFVGPLVMKTFPFYSLHA